MLIWRESASITHADDLRNIATEIGAVLRSYGGVWCKDNTSLEFTIKVSVIYDMVLIFHALIARSPQDIQGSDGNAEAQQTTTLISSVSSTDDDDEDDDDEVSIWDES